MLMNTFFKQTMKTKTTAKWVVVLTILLAQLPLNTKAQDAPRSNGEVTQTSENGLPQNFLFNGEATKITGEVTGKVFLMQKLNLTAPYSLALISQKTDKIGMIHYRYRLTYKNYPVENTMYLLHTKNGVPVSANGDYVNDISLTIGNIISENKAIETAYKSEGVAYTEEAQNWIKSSVKKAAEMKIIYLNATHSYKLVYNVSVVAGIGHQHEIAVDAISGKVVRKEDHFKCAKIHTIYSGEQNVSTIDSAGKFWLVDKVRGIRTYDAKGASTQGQEPTGADLVSNPTDEWQQADFSTGALDAHFAATAAYDYFFNTHNHKSYDGNGSPINSYVNVDIGPNPNAFWGGFMVISKPVNGILLSTLDIVSHEISHGVSSTSAGFQNSGETGALGEAYSDMFGSLIEKLMYPNYPDSLNYQTGEQFSEFGRDFINPETFNNPRYYKGKNWDASNQDVHKNGNVHSHWMYLVSEGDANYTNEKNENFNIKGIGREKVGEIIFRALTLYLTPKSGYQESMLYTIQAAKDLYGACSDEVKTIKTAWKAVGLEVDDDPAANAEFSFSKSRCENPVKFTFINTKGSNKTYNWNFGDGTTSTRAAPSKTFSASGKYTVKLDVVGCTNDTKSYSVELEVDNNVHCDSSLMPENAKSSVESCTGLLRSATGADGVYLPSNTSEVTVRNSNNSPYEFEFTSFEMGYFTDRLEVYDGVGTGGAKIGEFTVQNAPNGKYKSTTGAITFKETTDGFSDYDGSGFEVYYICDSKTAPNSVQDITAKKVKIWPNPASGNLNIYNESGIKAYTITDISGTTIEQTEVNTINANINLSTYTNGLYFINVTTNEGIYTEKVIVQHN